MTQYYISTGRSRRETRWQIAPITWDELVEKLTEPHRTAESTADYHAMAADRRAEIKDVGGFVGGPVTGGRRVRGSVTRRSLLTLDLDNVPDGYDAQHEPTDALGCNAILYSTHSHRPEAPRLRLIVPLDREVNVDEYEAIARKVAEVIGIDFFDDTTYQPERLMYWPSCSADGEFLSTSISHLGPLNADHWLAKYRDWRDISQWPRSSRQDDIVRRAIKKQQDPLTKPGIVGAFCRTYTVAEAIAAYLPEVYTATLDPLRYTYAQGSSALGLVIYDGRYAYSHHATDPAGGKLCNAFDLVRLHRFGELDAEAKADTPANRLPSYTAMAAEAGRDTAVAAQIRQEAEEREAAILGDFAAEECGDAAPRKAEGERPSDPLSLLSLNKEGNALPTYENIDNILLNDPKLRTLFRYDLFHSAVMLTRPYETHVPSESGDRYTDTDVSNVKSYLERAYGMKNGGGEKVRERIEAVARIHRYHPVRDYLDELKWDGTPRLDSLFIDHNGAPDTALTRRATRITLTAAVARIYEPGCKFDYVLTLQGPEGTGKSTIIHRLGLGKWNKEGLASMGADRNAAEQLPGSWLIEISELAAMRRNEVEEVKAFVSTRTDTYRPAYGRSVESYPRQCIFIATTNETDFLKGTTGNRRFWVLPCTKRDNPEHTALTITRATIDQVWAEAVMRYKTIARDEDGAPILCLPEALEHEMRQRQEEFSEFADDDRRGIIAEYLDAWVDDNEIAHEADGLSDPAALGYHRRDRVCLRQILTEVLRINPDTPQGKYERKAVKKLMESFPEWQEASMRIKGFGFTRGYTRIGAPEEPTKPTVLTDI